MHTCVLNQPTHVMLDGQTLHALSLRGFGRELGLKPHPPKGVQTTQEKGQALGSAM